MKTHERSCNPVPAVAAVCFLLAGVCAVDVAAQEEHPLESANTSSPRSTLTSFLEGWDELFEELQERGESNYSQDETSRAAQRVTRCLDLSQVPPTLQRGTASEAAVCLKEVLDRISLPLKSEIPDEEELEKQAAAGTELVHWTIPHTEIKLSRIEEGPRTGEWLFDPDTVDRANEFYRQVRHLPARDTKTSGLYAWYLSNAGPMIPDSWIHALPDWTRRTIYKQPVWKWIGLFLTLVVGVSVMLLIYALGRRVASRVRETSMLGYLVTLVFPLAAMLVPLAGKHFMADQLLLRGTVLKVVTIGADIVFLLALFFVVVGAGNRIAELIISAPRIHPQGIDAQFIRLVSRIVSLIAAVVVFLEGGRILGVPLTTLLAGAGVGGLTLALAAQDTVKNILGSMMITLDKPYRVGERIVTKKYDGAVEEIGLRSTKLRLLTGHQVSIPNEEMARSDIENIGRRPHIRRSAKIAIPLDTPPDKALRAVDIIREILTQHEGQSPEYPPRVYLSDFNRDSLNIHMFYWYHPPDYWDFMAFSQKVNVEIMQRFESEGIRLALPASTTYVSQDEEHPVTWKATSEPTSEAAGE